VDGFHLLCDVVTVDGQVVGHRYELRKHHPSRRSQKRGKTQDDQNRCQCTRQSQSFQQAHHRRQQKCEQNGKGKRQE
jgi:hypothetical protein